MSAPSRLWKRLTRATLSRGTLSRRRLAQFCAEVATDAPVLVVHSVDVDHRRYFPNAFVVSSRTEREADLHTDPHYRGLSAIAAASHGTIVCTGLLEHVPDPDRLIAEFHRILEPGGRLILSASAVFPFHGAPNNYFHFTPHGLRHLFRDWSRVEVLRGATSPFETVAILLQRINMQCDVFPPARLLIEVLHRLAPALDVFVLRQYDSRRARGKEPPTDAFMPATLHAVVIR